MKKLFTRTQFAVFLASLASFVMGWVTEVSAKFLPGGDLWILAALVLLALGLWSLALRLTPRRQLVRPVFQRPPLILRTPTEKQAHARQGVVAFISLYTPRPGSPARSLTADERLAAARNLDYKRLDLENSNLWPTIQAITTHVSRLEHCWLVSTTAADVTRHGSFLYAPVLAKYLEEACQIPPDRIHGYTDDRYAIPLDDDALVTVKTYEVMEKIFTEAEGLGLSNKEMVADFTSGFRSMPLGMILACLDGSRDIQFQGSHYNEQGDPVNGLFPILFDFEAQLVDIP